MSPDADRELIDAARRAQQRAYAPYSLFRVGAALRARSGAIYEGCNVENASYGATLCAERVALAAMVAGGELGWTRIAIATEADPPAPPCGTCLQMLVEFADDGAVVLAGDSGVRTLTLRELLPNPFVLRSSDGGDR